MFDFEPVMRKNVPPAHFGYMASGIDDEVTLRANREGFQKFQLRPRRLVDVSKVDMSVELLGVKYNSPIIVAPTGGHRGYHPDGEIASPRGQDRRPPARSSRPRRPPRSRTRSRRAARRSGTSSTPPTTGRSPSTLSQRAESRAPSPSRSRSTAAAAATRRRFPAAPRTRAMHRLPRPQQPRGQHKAQADVRGRRPVGADQHPVLGHDLGLRQAAARPPR